ncbi:MAG: portal protein [Thiohalomonadales bacterium]
MSLSHAEVKRYHDKWYSAGQTTRRRAADDMVFYFLTHWDSNTLEESQLAYRGEFDILKKALKRIIASLRANPVQVNFESVDEDREDGAELIDGLYRKDMRRNTSIEAFNNGSKESIVCGVGAWELYTKYESNKSGNNNQVIRLRPTYEANNNLFWDDNAKLQDKSDAIGCSYIEPYSADGWKRLVKELTGEEVEVISSSFGHPEISYTFPWIASKNQIIYVVRLYFKEKVKDRALTLIDPVGQELILLESSLKDEMDDLLEEGYTIDESRTKKIERWEVTQYIASGDRILSTEVINGEHIPFVPIYGERGYVEGEEHYEGLVKSAKDPQRLRDFQMSYLADIVSCSPRSKPIVHPEQVEGYQDMWEITGADNNYPYLFLNRTDANGEDLPAGILGESPEQKVPQSLMLSLQETRKAVSDVLPPDMGDKIAEIDLSGKALREINLMMSEQTMLYQENLKHAKRRTGEIYASMASAIIDSPRKVKITTADGTTKTVEVMQMVQDEETGELKTFNDITNMEFDVFAEIGQSYTTLQEETFDKLGEMAVAMETSDPQMSKSLRLQQLTLIDGVELKNVRENARMQLILSEFMKPETDEEKEMLEQAQNQPQQPDPSMVMAQAEQAKADAAMAENQVTAQRDAANQENDRSKAEIDAYNAETKRFEVQVDAAKANADVDIERERLVVEQNENVLRFRAAVNG